MQPRYIVVATSQFFNSQKLMLPIGNCLQVHWRFLQHQNPKLPQFDSVGPLNSKNATKLQRRVSSSHARRDSLSRLVPMFDIEGTDMKKVLKSSAGRNGGGKVTTSVEKSRASRAMNDLTGETQRQAMMDRILLDMEHLAFEPTDGQDQEPMLMLRKDSSVLLHEPSMVESMRRKGIQSPVSANRRLTEFASSRTQEECLDEGDDSRTAIASLNEQRQRLDQDEGPPIFWQKTTGAISATNVPDRLLMLSPSPPHQMNAVSNSPRKEDRRRVLPNRAANLPRQPGITRSGFSRKFRQHENVRTLTAPASPSPMKPKYGAWYVPQSKWWTLYQSEQSNYVKKSPIASSSGASELDRSMSSKSCTHKPQLPLAAISSNAVVATKSALQTARATKNDGARSLSARSRKLGSRSARGSIEFKVGDISQSYIGHEYRAYIVRTGSHMPRYLQ